LQLNQKDVLSVFDVKTVGPGQKLEVKKAMQLNLKQGGKILDMAFKKNKIFVATTERRIYQYSAIDLHRKKYTG
jgi:co-chaperonin GroES (HSP10)